MGLFIQQNDQRTKLQEKIAADLRAKAKAQQQGNGQKPKDLVEDMSYLDGTKRTTSLAWVWVIIAIAVVALVIFVITRANS